MLLRGDPYALIDLDTKNYAEYPYNGMWIEDSSETTKATTEIGFYYHPGSGSTNSFYDGTEHWLDRGGCQFNNVPKSYNKYVFLYKPL
jgi:hypothetical protein